MRNNNNNIYNSQKPLESDTMNYCPLQPVENNNKEILMGIGDRCYIHNCIVDKNCRIGDDVRINGGRHIKNIETDNYMVKDGIVVIKKDATIAKGTIIG